MTTVFMSPRDFREAQRSPHGAHRAHAICRRLVATATQNSHWYGAHYWAACALTTRDGNEQQNLARWKSSFAIETSGGEERELPGRYRGLWNLAVRRVRAVLSEAMALETSVLW